MQLLGLNQVARFEMVNWRRKRISATMWHHIASVGQSSIIEAFLVGGRYPLHVCKVRFPVSVENEFQYERGQPKT
uniref:Uncharacterized protein MANES_S079200 n=1 Tax=Rhizophora mucronata TaxID=61149 RepID=A0A2P2JAL4_RHIMU